MNSTSDTSAPILIDVCVDCIMIIANDDSSGMDDDTLAAVREGIAALARAGYNLAPADHVTDFSTTTCGCCHSSLAGMRMEVALLAR